MIIMIIIVDRVFNCILVHFIPLYLTLSFTLFYSFTSIYISLILFLYSILSTLFPCTCVHCTGLFYSFIFFILFYFCLLFFLVVHCTGVGGTIPRGQSLCESMSLCRCLVFILCMPVCNYTLRLTLCAVYGYYLYLSNLFLFSTVLSTNIGS